MKNKKEASKTKKTTAHYNLGNIRQLIDQGKVRIRPNALSSAFNDFGWGIDEIKKAIKKLQPKYYYKPEDHYDKPGIESFEKLSLASLRGAKRRGNLFNIHKLMRLLHFVRNDICDVFQRSQIISCAKLSYYT